MSRLSYIRYMYNMAVEQSEKPYPLSAISILLFHDCVELFLQLVSEHLGVGKNGCKFMDYWNEIEQKTKYLLTQKDAMKRLNESRVIFKHNGVKVDRSEINVFLVSVTNFFEENTYPVFDINFDSISTTSLVRDDNVRQGLESADGLVSTGDIKGAIRKVSIAFEQLVNNFIARLFEHEHDIFSGYMRLPRPHSHGPIRAENELSKFIKEFDKFAGQAEKAFNKLANRVKLPRTAKRP